MSYPFLFYHVIARHEAIARKHGRSVLYAIASFLDFYDLSN